MVISFIAPNRRVNESSLRAAWRHAIHEGDQFQSHAQVEQCARGATHYQASRPLANRLVGMLRGRVRSLAPHGTGYRVRTLYRDYDSVTRRVEWRSSVYTSSPPPGRISGFGMATHPLCSRTLAQTSQAPRRQSSRLESARARRSTKRRCACYDDRLGAGLKVALAEAVSVASSELELLISGV